MKNSKFKFVSMLFALCFVFVSTLAFSPVDSSEDAVTIVQGHYWNPTVNICAETTVRCQIDFAPVKCKIQNKQLYKLDGTSSCPNELYKIQ